MQGHQMPLHLVQWHAGALLFIEVLHDGRSAIAAGVTLCRLALPGPAAGCRARLLQRSGAALARPALVWRQAGAGALTSAPVTYQTTVWRAAGHRSGARPRVARRRLQQRLAAESHGCGGAREHWRAQGLAG